MVITMITSDPIDAVLVNLTITPHSASSMIAANGTVNRSTPAPVATPFPPLNL